MNEAAEEVWVVASKPCDAAGRLARDLNLPEPITRILIARGIDTPEAVSAFFAPTLDQLHDPGCMLGMRKAVSRIRAALSAREPILIYGDYDVDGTVATVLLKVAAERAAISLGVTADVRYHIPHRIREGYGMQDERIAAAAAEGIRLVISVDTGIRAFAAAAEASRVGIDLIITDHHLPDGMGVPEAIAVINPNQAGCPYLCKELCGAAVAFKLAQALLEASARDADDLRRLREKLLPSFLKLLAIATIADAVPLTGENRVIVSIGLKELRQPAQPGLRALMELAGIDTSRDISATDVGFRLAPRINAAGRMDIASDVVEMFLSRDAANARLLAEKLHRLNDERRSSEAEALRSIEAMIDPQSGADQVGAGSLPACLVLDDAAAGKGWHRGVIGILASRVVDRTGRPALVITHEDGQAYGSGRSIHGFHLLDALTSAHAEDGTLLTRFGGHAHAVGFSLPSDRVQLLRERMERIAEQAERTTAPELHCDAEIELGSLTPDFLQALEQLGPFGMGHPEPTFISRGVRLTIDPRIVQERHLRISVEDGDTRFSGMAWSRRTDWAQAAQAQGWAKGQLMDIAYRMRRNWHPQFGGWELEIASLRATNAASGPSNTA